MLNRLMNLEGYKIHSADIGFTIDSMRRSPEYGPGEPVNKETPGGQA